MLYLEILNAYSYPLTITIIFIGIYIFVNFKVKKTERLKLGHIKKRHIQDAVETESPLKNQEKHLKDIGIHGMENRFSFINKALPFVLFSLWSLFVFIPYLGQIPTVYISVIAAVLSVIAGVSLRPFLENVFSGIVISFFKAIRIGDTVIIDGHYGLIEEIGLTYSVLKRWDWNRIVIPNSSLLQKEIQSLTMNDNFIWAYVEFFISPDVNIEKVESISKEVAKDSKYFNKVEDPSFWIMDLQKNAIKCWLAAWANSPSDAWELRNDMRTNLIKRLQNEKIKFHQFNLNSSNISFNNSVLDPQSKNI